MHAIMCDYLIFGELPLQAAYVLGSFCDLRLQAGGVSHLWVLLVHPLHLLQCFTEVRGKCYCLGNSGSFCVVKNKTEELLKGHAVLLYMASVRSGTNDDWLVDNPKGSGLGQNT